MTYNEAKEILLAGGYLCVHLDRYRRTFINGKQLRSDTVRKLFATLNLVEFNCAKNSYGVKVVFYALKDDK